MDGPLRVERAPPTPSWRRLASRAKEIHSPRAGEIGRERGLPVHSSRGRGAGPLALGVRQKLLAASERPLASERAHPSGATQDASRARRTCARGVPVGRTRDARAARIASV